MRAVVQCADGWPSIGLLAMNPLGFLHSEEWVALEARARATIAESDGWSCTLGVFWRICSQMDCEALVMLSRLNSCRCVAGAWFENDAVWVKLEGPKTTWADVVAEITSADHARGVHTDEARAFADTVAQCTGNGPLTLGRAPSVFQQLRTRVNERLQLNRDESRHYYLVMNLEDQPWSLFELATLKYRSQHRRYMDPNKARHRVFYDPSHLTVALSRKVKSKARRLEARNSLASCWLKEPNPWQRAQALKDSMPASIRNCTSLIYMNLVRKWEPCRYRWQCTSLGGGIFYSDRPLRLLIALQCKLPACELTRVEWDSVNDRFALHVSSPEGRMAEPAGLQEEPEEYLRQPSMVPNALEILCSADIYHVMHLPPVGHAQGSFDSTAFLSAWLSSARIPQGNEGSAGSPVSAAAPTLFELVAELRRAGLRCVPSPQGTSSQYQQNPFPDLSMFKLVYWTAYCQALNVPVENGDWDMLAARQPVITPLQLLRSLEKVTKVSLNNSAFLLDASNSQASFAVHIEECTSTEVSDGLRIPTRTPVIMLGVLLQSYPHLKIEVTEVCQMRDAVFHLLIRGITKAEFHEWGENASADRSVTQKCAAKALDALLRARWSYGARAEAGCHEHKWLPSACSLANLARSEDSKADARQLMRHCAEITDGLSGCIGHLSFDTTVLPFWQSLLFRYLTDTCVKRTFQFGTRIWQVGRQGRWLKVSVINGTGSDWEQDWKQLMNLKEWHRSLKPLEEGWYQLLLEAYDALVPALPQDPIANGVLRYYPSEAGFLYALKAEPAPFAQTVHAVSVSSCLPVTMLALLIMIEDQMGIGEVRLEHEPSTWLRFRFTVNTGTVQTTSAEVEAEIEAAIDHELKQLRVEATPLRYEAMVAAIDVFFRLLCLQEGAAASSRNPPADAARQGGSDLMEVGTL